SAAFAQVEAQYAAHVAAYRDDVSQEQAALEKAKHDLDSSLQNLHKLEQTLPIYREQESVWAHFGKEGFAGRMQVLDRQRMRIETEHELNAQTHNIESLRASIAQSEKKLSQITTNYRQQ